jgi:hypothetical protein
VNGDASFVKCIDIVLPYSGGRPRRSLAPMSRLICLSSFRVMASCWA